MALFYGALSGTGIAVAGWLKSRTKEEFDARRLLQTILLGVVVGVVGTQMNWDYGQAYGWVANMGGVAVVENLAKAVWRHLPEKPKKVPRKRFKTDKKESVKTDGEE